MMLVSSTSSILLILVVQLARLPIAAGNIPRVFKAHPSSQEDVTVGSVATFTCETVDCMPVEWHILTNTSELKNGSWPYPMIFSICNAMSRVRVNTLRIVATEELSNTVFQCAVVTELSSCRDTKTWSRAAILTVTGTSTPTVTPTEATEANTAGGTTEVSEAPTTSDLDTSTSPTNHTADPNPQTPGGITGNATDGNADSAGERLSPVIWCVLLLGIVTALVLR